MYRSKGNEKYIYGLFSNSSPHLKLCLRHVLFLEPRRPLLTTPPADWHQQSAGHVALS